jgi:hypothetical protein
MVLIAASLTAITTFALWLKRTRRPGKQASVPAKAVGGALLIFMAVALASFVRSHHGKSGHAAIATAAILCLAAVYTLQWFIDRRQF